MPDTDILTAGMIAEARAQGLTWAQIGTVLSGGKVTSPKLAKKRAHAIAREANRRAAAMLAEEAPDA